MLSFKPPHQAMVDDGPSVPLMLGPAATAGAAARHAADEREWFVRRALEQDARIFAARRRQKSEGEIDAWQAQIQANALESVGLGGLSSDSVFGMVD